MVSPPTLGLSLCAGGGGLDLGLGLAEPGFATAGYVEIEEYPRQCLIAAQNAGYMHPAPIWDDLKRFSGRPFRGVVDTVLAGYPCQPFSAAGKRRGADDPRHLWPDVARIIDECGATWAFLENVAGHVSLGLETVLRDLWEMGFTPAAGIFSAGETGAPHERQRVFIVAHRDTDADPRRVDGGRIGRAASRCESDGAQRQRLRTGAGSGGNVLAHPDGRHPGAEREQRSGEQRFQSPGGRTGADDVENAGYAGGRQGVATGHVTNRNGAGRAQADGRLGKSGESLDHPNSPRSQQARRGSDERGDGNERGQPMPGDRRGEMGHASGIGRGEGRAEHEFRGGRDASASASGAVADTGQPGSQGRERPGSPDERNRPPAPGSASERRGVPLFPPGPGDTDAWADTLATSPHLAPAAGLGDCLAWARDLASSLEGQNRAQAQPALRRMAHGLATRSRALRLLGNGVVPIEAAYAWRSLATAHGLGQIDFTEEGKSR